jgi:hypothetical protein
MSLPTNQKIAFELLRPVQLEILVNRASLQSSRTRDGLTLYQILSIYSFQTFEHLL